MPGPLGGRPGTARGRGGKRTIQPALASRPGVRPTGIMQRTPRSARRTPCHGNGARGVQVTAKIVSAILQEVIFWATHWVGLAACLPAGPVPGLVQPGEVGVVGVQMLVVVDGAARPRHGRCGLAGGPAAGSRTGRCGCQARARTPGPPHRGPGRARRGPPSRAAATRVSKLDVRTVSSQPRLTVPTRSACAHIRKTSIMKPSMIASPPIHMTAPPACRSATGPRDPAGRAPRSSPSSACSRCRAPAR